MTRTYKTQNLILCSLFASLIAVSAFIVIPIPLVPFTLQMQAAMLSCLVLGNRGGTKSIFLYILMGLLGLPIFSGGYGGISSVLNPTFGYVIGFAAASWIAGSYKNKPYIAITLFITIVYLCGMIHLYLISLLLLGEPLSITKLLISGCLITLPKDILLSFIVLFIFRHLNKLSL